MASITLASYRRVLDGFWRPRIGAQRFLDVRYSTLVKIADNAAWSKKSYNNAISILRRAFKFGYRDHPEKHDPTLGLKSVRIRKKDRPIIDPFTMQEAEALIAAIHRDWGDAQGNYDEFRFFTGLRPSEQIALVLGDFDPSAGTPDAVGPTSIGSRFGSPAQQRESKCRTRKGIIWRERDSNRIAAH